MCEISLLSTSFCTFVPLQALLFNLTLVMLSQNKFLLFLAFGVITLVKRFRRVSLFLVNDFYTFVPLQALSLKWTLVMFLQNKFLLLFGVTSLVNRLVTNLGHQGVRRVF